MSDTIRAAIRKIIYNTDDFYIMEVKILQSTSKSSQSTTVTARSVGLLQFSEGMSLAFHGIWDQHPRYGNQFKAYAWSPWVHTTQHIIKFLLSGVDSLYVYEDTIRALVHMYKTDVLSVLSDLEMPENLDGHCLDLETGEDFVFDKDTLCKIQERWLETLSLSEILLLLQKGGIDTKILLLIVGAYKGSSKEVLERNPWEVASLQDISFADADKVAQAMGRSLKDPQRLEGAILCALKMASNDGHLYLTPTVIVESFNIMVEGLGIPPIACTQESFTSALINLKNQGLVKTEKWGVYLPSLHNYEAEAASYMVDALVKKDVTPLLDNMEGFLKEYQGLNQLDLSEDQIRALECVNTSSIFVLTGLPGTGKTSVTKAIVRLFEQAGIQYRLMAPTGIASKRLAALTGRPASTIHRTLGYDGNNWRLNKYDRIPTQAVIVDESSMLNQEILYRILDALDNDTRIVFVGDDAQLPSVGAGNVLRNLLACTHIPHVRLTKIFRQSETGGIVVNAHKIHHGEDVYLGEDDPEFRVIPMDSEEKISDLVVEMATKLKKTNRSFQILTPIYRGNVGVLMLNDKLRDALNPPHKTKSEWSRGSLKLRLGDRVMVTQNDYKLGVYNGDMAKITSITTQRIEIKVHGASPTDIEVLVEIPTGKVLSLLTLGYAISVHKSQGMEYDVVIMPCVRAQGRLLQRNVLYTAVTRAKKQVWVLGQVSALRKSIQNNEVVDRNSKLSYRIDTKIAENSPTKMPTSSTGVEVSLWIRNVL